MTRSGRITTLLLAAGRATRFGSTKQLAPVGGRPLIRLCVESLLGSGMRDVVVVLGHEAERVRRALNGLPVRTLVNDRFGDGMGSSLATGIASLEEHTAAVLVALGDQPVAADIIERLVEEWRLGQSAIVAPVYAGRRGNPVLFDATVFPELARLSGDRGARDLVDGSADRVALVEFDFPAPPDVDRPADLAILRQGSEGESGDAGQPDRPGLL